jgi:hypothetical protein
MTRALIIPNVTRGTEAAGIINTIGSDLDVSINNVANINSEITIARDGKGSLDARFDSIELNQIVAGGFAASQVSAVVAEGAAIIPLVSGTSFVVNSIVAYKKVNDQVEYRVVTSKDGNNISVTPAVGASGIAENAYISMISESEYQAAQASPHGASISPTLKDAITWSKRYNVISFGAIGDGIQDDTLAIQATIASAILGGGYPVYFPKGSYKVTSQIDFTGTSIISDGAIIKRTDSLPSTYVLSAGGTLGSYTAIDSDALKDQNVIVCTALAASVVTGDLIKIKSNLVFATDPTEGIVQGEMAIVKSVSGNNIYLRTALFDNYLVSNVAQVAKVNPIKFFISGELTVENYPATTLGETRGVLLSYTIGTKIDKLNIRGTSYLGIVLRNCYAPDVNVYSDGVRHTNMTAQTSYGIQIGNSTMFPIVKGVYVGHRHCVTFGGNTAEQGVTWGAKVIGVVGTGADLDAAVFDTHESVGGVEFLGCTAYGGLLNTVRPIAFGLGARYNYVSDCKAINCNNVLRTRDGAHIEDLIITNLVFKDCGTHAIYPKRVGQIKNLVIDGVNGYFASDNGSYAINLEKGSFLKIRINNVSVNNGGLLHINNVANVPAIQSKIILDNCKCDADATLSTADLTRTGITNLNTGVVHIILNNCYVGNRGVGIYNVVDMDALEFNNCNFYGNNRHGQSGSSDLYGLRITKIFFRGGTFRGTTRDVSLSVHGIYNYWQDPGSVMSSFVFVDGISTDEKYIIGNSGGITSASIGLNDLPTTFISYGRRSPEATIVTFSGAKIAVPAVFNCTGTPEGSINAPIGSLCLRSDGGANTTLYVKESGTGSVGWVAK